ncbi:MAG: polymorphic toxin-type HINT domain-containing protein, partial [Cyanobacteria bacterium J06636_16]
PRYMKTKDQLRQLLGIVLALMEFFLCTTEVAYARGGGGGGGSGGCFASDTPILTPEGYKPINQLKQGSQVIGYSLSRHQPEIGTVGALQEISAAEYYVINDVIRVTGTHPFYVLTPEAIKQVEVRQLKIGDQLLGKESDFRISSLQHVSEPITVYNLISVTPNHNFYAGGFLVHNKGGSGIYPSGANGRSFSTPSFKAVLFLLIGLVPGAFLIEIYNFIRFRGKEFTEDEELIKHTQTISPEFTNRYSIRYRRGDDLWETVSLKSSIDPHQYQHLLSDQELFENASHLFTKYQQDWMNKDFTMMKQYVSEPFYTNQRNIFQQNYGEGFDIIYQLEALEMALLSFRKEQDQHFFEIQINAKMTNFSISSQGYVIRGEPYPRSFTEYWTFRLDAGEKWWLTDISTLYFTEK